MLPARPAGGRAVHLYCYTAKVYFEQNALVVWTPLSHSHFSPVQVTCTSLFGCVVELKRLDRPIGGLGENLRRPVCRIRFMLKQQRRTSSPANVVPGRGFDCFGQLLGSQGCPPPSSGCCRSEWSYGTWNTTLQAPRCAAGSARSCGKRNKTAKMTTLMVNRYANILRRRRMSAKSLRSAQF